MTRKVNRQISIDLDVDMQMKIRKDVNWSSFIENSIKIYLGLKDNLDLEESKIKEDIDFWTKKEQEARENRIKFDCVLVNFTHNKEKEKMKNKIKQDEHIKSAKIEIEMAKNIYDM